MRTKVISVAGIGAALKALRLPFQREPRSKVEISFSDDTPNDMVDKDRDITYACEEYLEIDHNDINLIRTLVKRGTEHCKVTRGMMVWMEITATRGWWQEMATYRIGVECLSSESTMHTLMTQPVEADSFATDNSSQLLADIIEHIKECQTAWKETKDPAYLRQAKELLPESFLQKRVVMFSYQALRNIYKQRHDHRLLEWQAFCEGLEDLPLSFLITENI